MKNKNFRTGILRTFDRAKAEETREVEFIISDETRDRHGTVIPLNSWDLKWFNENGIVGYQHDVYGDSFIQKPDPDDVIGVGSAYVEDGKLIGRVRFEKAENNPKAEKIFQKVLDGILKATSVGFIETKAGNWGEKAEARDGENPTYYFGDVQLLEFSIVNIPSNPAALRRTVDIMQADLEQEETIEALKAQNSELETRNLELTLQVETLKLNNKYLKMKRPLKVN